jgi:hypothetical protein
MSGFTWVQSANEGGGGSSASIYNITRDENGLARNTAPTIAEIQAWQNAFDGNNTTYSGATLAVGDQCIVTHFDNAVEVFYCTGTGPETWVQTSICYDLHMLNTEFLRNDPKALDDYPWNDGTQAYIFARAGVREASNVDNNELDAWFHNFRFGWMSWYNINGFDVNMRAQDTDTPPRDWEHYFEIGASTIGYYHEHINRVAQGPDIIVNYRNMDNAVNNLFYSIADDWSLIELNQTQSTPNVILRAHSEVDTVTEAKIQITGQPTGTDPQNIILQTEKVYATTATAGQVLTLQSTTSGGDLTGHVEFETLPLQSIATEDEGVSVDTTATTLDFVGAGVTATDAGGGKTTVTIPGGGAGGGGGGGNAFKGAQVRKNANQNLNNGDTTLSWQLEEYDTDSWHDNVTNNSRLTVPAGVSRVKLHAGLIKSTSTANLNMRFTKNGGNFEGQPWWYQPSAQSTVYVNLHTGPIDVVEGDYFEAVVNFATTGGVALQNTGTWFSIEEVGEYEPVHFIEREVVPYGTTITTGDGKAYVTIAAELDGFNLVAVGIAMGAGKPTGGGNVTVDLARLRAATAGAASRTEVDILSTNLTIDSNEWDSKDAATAAVIDAANDDMAEGDVIRVDIDQVGGGQAGDGLFVRLGFALP